MSCKTPFLHKIYDTGNPTQDYVYIPCGRCPACLKQKRRHWAFRLEQENKNSLSSYFVTLTYADENLPMNGSLDKKHLQDFFKRFRKKLCEKISNETRLRYFAVGEYGDTFQRPHYHVLTFFNCRVSLIDIALVISESWKLGKIDVGTVTPKSINYCAKYIVTYDKEPTLTIEDTGEVITLQRTFSLMSRKPAIGANFLTPSMKRYLAAGNFSLPLGNGVYESLPRYYKDKAIPKDVRREHTIEYMCKLEKNLKDKDYIEKRLIEDHFHFHHNQVKIKQL